MSEQFSLFDKNRKMILTLKEEYFMQIKKGEKQHEFRFKFPVEDVIAYIYLPTPVKKIVGVMELKNTTFMDIEKVSQFYVEEYNLSFDEMYDWIYPRKGCYVSKVSNMREFTSPIEYTTLKELFNFTAPQQYTYLDSKFDLLRFLEERQ